MLKLRTSTPRRFSSVSSARSVAATFGHSVGSNRPQLRRSATQGEELSVAAARPDHEFRRHARQAPPAERVASRRATILLRRQWGDFHLTVEQNNIQSARLSQSHAQCRIVESRRSSRNQTITGGCSERSLHHAVGCHISNAGGTKCIALIALSLPQPCKRRTDFGAVF